MPYRHEFLFPDYYKDFDCKCGDCRTTCCSGWGIALSQDEYFRVIGTECSSELRRRLDVAFRPATNPAPTPERYAMISYNWLGRCPLHTDDGFCALHRECGEAAIPEICRRYPRCIRTAPIHECCTSTSCERTLELLLANNDRLKFESNEIEIYDDEFDAPAAASLQADYYRKTRENAFDIISDRAFGIDARIERLAKFFGVELPYNIMPQSEAWALFDRLAKTSIALSEISMDISPYREKDSAIPRFSLDAVDNIDIYIEKILVNHVFYKGFPRSFENSTLEDELAALIAVRGLHRYATEAYIGVHGWSIDAFIDVTAKLFRMIEHSNFDQSASRFVQK